MEESLHELALFAGAGGGEGGAECIDSVKALWHNTDERSLNYAVASK